MKFPVYCCVYEYANKTDSQNHSTGEIDLLFLNSMQTIRQWMTFNVIIQIVLQLQKQLICMYNVHCTTQICERIRIIALITRRQ